MIDPQEEQIRGAEGDLKVAKAKYRRLVDEETKIENLMLSAATEMELAKEHVAKLKERRDG